MTQLIIAAPSETYLKAFTRKKAQKISRANRRFKKAFRQLLVFSDRYTPYATTPDFRRLNGEKKGKGKRLSIYAAQEIVRIGDLVGDWSTTTFRFDLEHLFPHPRCGKSVYPLPDLEVIAISGENLNLASSILTARYLKSGWEVEIVKENHPSTITFLGTQEGRRQEFIEYDPEQLLERAVEIGIYNRTKPRISVGENIEYRRGPKCRLIGKNLRK